MKRKGGEDDGGGSEAVAAAAVEAMIDERCDAALPQAQRAAMQRELAALRERFPAEAVAARFLAKLRQKDDESAQRRGGR
jgi:hypothetical protein